MKTLIILSLTMVSLNAFSAEVGEVKKGECIHSNQSSKRDAKVVDVPTTEDKKEVVRTMSK